MLTLALAVLVAVPDVVVIDSRGEPFRSETAVNGFSAEMMPSVQTIYGSTTGYPSWDHRCFPLHPYFLKPGGNIAVMTYTFDDSLVARDAPGPWTQSVEVVTSPLKDDAKPTPLAKQVSPAVGRDANGRTKTLTVSFTMPQSLPAWRWINGVAITDNKATADSLFAEYVKLWTVLDGLSKVGSTEREAFRAQARASTDEFVRASESRGKKYTFIDDLTYSASTLNMRGDEGMRTKPPKKGVKPVPVPSTAPVLDSPSDTGPNTGNHLTFLQLPPQSEMKLVVFAGGRLAKLVPIERQHAFGFMSNWTDGTWGARGESKLSFEAWYRKGANGAWELDALYPTYWGNVASLSVSSMVDGMAF